MVKEVRVRCVAWIFHFFQPPKSCTLCEDPVVAVHRISENWLHDKYVQQPYKYVMISLPHVFVHFSCGVDPSLKGSARYTKNPHCSHL